MLPTAVGWQCTRCQHEVVDFTRMSGAEGVAYLVARSGQRVCGFMASPLVPPQHYKHKRGVRQWLLAAATLFGWNYTSAAGLPPQPLPTRPVAVEPVVVLTTIQGVVLDDLSGAPVPGAYVFIGNTKYGAITDEQGKFSLTFPADWEPVRHGSFQVVVPRIPFNTQERTVEVKLVNGEASTPLTIRLLADEHRGYRGKAVIIAAPRPLSELGKESR